VAAGYLGKITQVLGGPAYFGLSNLMDGQAVVALSATGESWDWSHE
jgi:hypothetical protein